jgi:hypothetical protein
MTAGAYGEPSNPGARTAAELFAIVWETLADVIGTAAAATLVRRSARRARVDGLSVSRDGFKYTYCVPPEWSEDRPEPVLALRAVARELGPLLIELTGRVLLRRLVTAPELARNQILFEERDR